MATDLETLLVRLEVATSGFEAGLNKAETRLVRHAKNVDTTMSTIDKRLEKTSQAFNNFSRNIVATVATGLGAREIIRASDSYVTMDNRLRSATKSTAEYNKVSRELFQVAQSSRQSLSDVTDLYFRLGGAFTDAQKQAFPLIDITERLGKAFVVTGTEASQAQSFILQLSQAAASDFKAVGEEMNSLIAAAPQLTKAIAEELGLKSASAIKKFAKDGELNVNNFFEAFIRATDKINSGFSGMTITVEQSLTRLDNAFLKYIGQQDLVASGTSTLAAAINGLADNFELAGDAALIAAGIMGGRLVGSLAATSVLFLRNTQQALAYQAALVRMAGASATAAVASTALARSMAFFGGPIGLAITGLAIGLATLGGEIDTSAQFQEEHNVQIAKAKELYDKINKSSGDRAQMLRQEREAQLDLVRAKLLDAKATFEQAKAEASQLDNAIKSGFGSVGTDSRRTAAFDKALEMEKSYVGLINQYQDLVNIKKTGKAVTEQQVEAENKLSSSLNNGNASLDKKLKKTKDAAEQLYKTTLENERAAEQTEQLAYANNISEEAYKRLSRELEIKNRLDQQGFVIGTKLRKINEEKIRAELEAGDAIERTNQKRAEQLKAAEEYAEAMRRPIENAMEGIQNTISDTFIGVFAGSIKDAGDAADAIKKIFIRMAAEIATLELFGAGGLNIAGSVRGGALGSVTGASGSGGFGSITGSILKEGTSLLGGTAIGSSINAFGASALPSIFGMGTSIGPTTLAAGLGGAPLTTGAGILGGAGIGLSAIALPLVGLAIGALASSLFKKKPKSVASNFGGTIGTGGDLSGLVIRTNGKGDPETAKALSDGVQQVAKSLISAGVDVSGQIIQGGVDAGRGFLGVGNADYLTLRNGGAGAINFNPQGGEGAVSQAMAELALQLTNASAKGKEYAAQLQNITAKGRTAEDVLKDISFVLGFEDLLKAPQTFTELELAVKAMSEQFNKAASDAERLGLSVDRVREAEQKRMNELLGGITSDIANQILQIAAPIEAQLQVERNRYAAQLRDLQAVGAKQQDIQLAELLHKFNIEKLNENIAKQEDNRLQVAQDLEKRFANVQERMKGFLFELTNGQYSPLTPTANLASIRGQVTDLGARARLGDVEAQEKLAELLPAFVELSGQVNGFNANFEADRKIAEDLSRVTISVAERQVSLQQAQIAAIQQQTAITATGFMSLQDAISRVGGGLSAGAVMQAAGAGLSSAETWATQWGRSRGKLSSTEVAQGGLLASRLTTAEIAQFNIDKRVAGFFNGGLVGGIDGVDKNLSKLTKGEFVMNTAAVRSVGVNTMQSINNGGGDLINEIKSLRSDMKQLTQAVVVTGQLNNEQLQQISNTNASMASIERAIALRG